MRRADVALVGVLLLVGLVSAPARAQDSPLTAILGIGNFDVDTDRSDDAHLSEASYNLMLGFDFSRYLALDVEAMHIENASHRDVFDIESSFGGDALGVSARLQWPLAEDFSPYVRVGATALELNDARVNGESLDDSHTLPMYGLGVRGRFWFVEYVNYGKIDELYLEQLRGGVILRFGGGEAQ